jgi:putative transposase
VLVTLVKRAHAAVSATVDRAVVAARAALRPRSVVGGLLNDLVRSKRELLAENAALRQQLIVAARNVKRPAFRPLERGLLVVLAAMASNRRDTMLLVKPETVSRWHREGFRLLWRLKSKPQPQAPARLSSDTVELIRRMAKENRLWGAERIRGELLKLGIRVSKRTIQRHMRGARPTAPPRGRSWHSFLRNHTVWACDFLQTYDIWFRPIFAFFIVDINTKRVVQLGVTRAPTQAWTAQQLRNAMPFDEGPQFIIRDRDDKFGADFDRVAKGAGARVIRTAVRAPLINSICERFIGSVRRECLDHIVILHERHMESVLDEYCFAYFNGARPHQGIGQRVPVPSSDKLAADTGTITVVPVLGGLHHEYRRVA